jgi:hypothetical protein
MSDTHSRVLRQTPVTLTRYAARFTARPPSVMRRTRRVVSQANFVGLLKKANELLKAAVPFADVVDASQWTLPTKNLKVTFAENVYWVGASLSLFFAS